MKIDIYAIPNTIEQQLDKIDGKVKILALVTIVYIWLTESKIRLQNKKMKLLAEEIDELKHERE